MTRRFSRGGSSFDDDAALFFLFLPVANYTTPTDDATPSLPSPSQRTINIDTPMDCVVVVRFSPLRKLFL